MAAPYKTGLDYFPLDVDIDQDDKVALIEAQFPEKGFEIIIKLLAKIYKEGYYYQWTNKEKLLFLSNRIRNSVNMDYLDRVIDSCLDWGFFDRELFNKYKILTSRGIQKRYFKICNTARRKDVKIIRDFLLLNNVNSYINLNNVVFYSIKSNINTTKEREREREIEIEKEIEKEIKNENENTHSPGNGKIKYAEFVLLKEEEYQKLVEKHDDLAVKRMIEILDNYKGSKGKTYKSDYRAILNWVEESYFEKLNKGIYNDQARGRSPTRNSTKTQISDGQGYQVDEVY